MEKNIQLDELQELRNQLTLLNNKLEKQEIINERLIKNSIKNKISGMKINSVTWSIVSLCTIPIIILACKHLNMSLTATIFLCFFICFASIYNIWTLIGIKNKIINENLIRTKEKILQAKKREKNRIYFCLPLVIVWILVMKNEDFFSHINPIEFIIESIVFIMLGFYIHNKRNKNMDNMIKQIEELKKEE